MSLPPVPFYFAGIKEQRLRLMAEEAWWDRRSCEMSIMDSSVPWGLITGGSDIFPDHEVFHQ